MSDLTLVIIAWNNLFFVRRFIDQIVKLKIPNPILILDNASTYQPLFSYYQELKTGLLKDRIEIWYIAENLGHEVYKKLSSNLPQIYLLSDPDLELNPTMPANVGEQLLAISEKYGCGKIGLSLDLADHDKFIVGGYGDLVYKIESDYYKNRVEDVEYELYVAPTDTTFCLVNSKYDFNRGLRVGDKFTAKHLPWYDGFLQENVPHDELEIWVRENKSSSILQYVSAEKILSREQHSLGGDESHKK
jgi:hypothetical protein